MYDKIKEILGEEYPEFYLYAVSRDGVSSFSIYDSGEITRHIAHTGDKKSTAFALRNFIHTLLGAAYSLLPTPSIRREPKKTGGKK